jgi:TonB-dependent SusC/RagA subfamily outer membrane receptor
LYYFQKGKKDVAENADLLMLTNGWRRYYWSDILNDNYPLLKYESEQGITLKGKITHDIIKYPYKNADVKLSIMDQYNDEFNTTSGKGGSFVFNNLDYSDTIDVKITVRKPDGGKSLLILLDENTPDVIKEYSGDFFLTTQSNINKKEYRRITNQIAKDKMEEREKELDSIFSGSIYGRPDFVLWGEDFPSGANNLFEIMQGRIPGVSITGNQIVIRGVGTLMGSTDPLVLVDGVPSGTDVLGSIPPNDVDRIEILKGSSTAIYGSRGGNGVIAVYTKHGTFMVKGQISFSLLGYHVKEKYHAPAVNEMKTREQNNLLPITVLWSPELLLNTDHETKISFSSPKTTSKLILVIEGIDTDGNPGTSLINLSR